MSQDGFEFGPPPPRREPRRFEPPPWERDQFERRAKEAAELERARLEAEQARQAAEAAEQAQVETAATPLARTEGRETEASANAEADPAARRPSEDRPRAHVNDPATVGAHTPLVRDSKPAGRPVDEKQVELMMLELKAEEPAALEGAWKVAIGAGMVVALVGIIIGIWGAVAIARLGQAGLFGGMVLVTFGLAFVGIGAWLGYGALRQRGVL